MSSISDPFSSSRGASCTCYECVGPDYEWRNGHKRVTNNFKYHTFLEPCDTCGEPKTEYRDLGRKGYYVCWWCTQRTNTEMNL